MPSSGVLHRRFVTPLLLLLVAVTVWRAAVAFRAQHPPEEIHPSPALTRIVRLSDYNPLLAGTPGDSDVYVFTGPEPGGTLLVAGGTHATEIAGVMTAVLLVETLEVRAGSVFVLPRANASAATHTRPREGHPTSIEIATAGGPRRFRYGSRFTNPVHQAPDPGVFLHPLSPVVRTGQEARNLNRVYPGRRDGTLTERVAWSIIELIRAERIDLAFDLHEAPPDRDLVNAVVASEHGVELAAEAVIVLQLDGWDFHLESSATEFRGLSHREWTDATDTRPFLMETASPVQGRLRGRTSAQAAVTGRDDSYLVAGARGLLAMPYGTEGVPLEERIAHHLAGMAAILAIHNADPAARPVEAGGWPDAASLRARGLGAYLAPPDAAEPSR